MITHTVQVTVFVVDGDDARDFYTDVLGFVVRTDEESGEGWRYLTVAPTEDAETVPHLVEVDGPVQEELTGKQAADRPLVVLASDDIQDDYRTMKENGVAFHGESWSVPGGHGVRFEDPDGNQFDLYQPNVPEDSP